MAREDKWTGLRKADFCRVASKAATVEREMITQCYLVVHLVDLKRALRI